MNNANKNDLIVQPKIDLIKFSIDKQDNSISSQNIFFNKINSLSINKVTRFKKGKKGYNHTREMTLLINGKEYKCILSECKYENFMPYLLAIHDPDKAMMPVLNNHLSLLDIYNINRVEYAFDFTYYDKVELYDFMKSKLVLLWRGKPLHLSYQTTHYLNNNWTAFSKAGKVYQKMTTDSDGNQQAVVRVEITLKHQYFKKRGINKCIDIQNVSMIDVYKYICFKVFNYNLFTNKLKELKYDNEFIENLKNLFRQDIINGFLHETNVTAKTYCINKNYLKEHKFNKHFKGNLKGISFWDQEQVLLDSGIMGL